MTKARNIANLASDGSALADGTINYTDITGTPAAALPLTGGTLSGALTLNGALNGVTSVNATTVAAMTAAGVGALSSTTDTMTSIQYTRGSWQGYLPTDLGKTHAGLASSIFGTYTLTGSGLASLNWLTGSVSSYTASEGYTAGAAYIVFYDVSQNKSTVLSSSAEGILGINQSVSSVLNDKGGFTGLMPFNTGDKFHFCGGTNYYYGLYGTWTASPGFMTATVTMVV